MEGPEAALTALHLSFSLFPPFFDSVWELGPGDVVAGAASNFEHSKFEIANSPI